MSLLMRYCNTTGCSHGKDSMIAKVAYHLIPVASPATLFKHVLGESEVPFGVRSAPNISMQLLMLWNGALAKKYLVEWIYHYLVTSQFLVSSELSISIPYRVCRVLRVPLALEKQIGPSTT